MKLIECFDEALAIDPNDALAWYNKGTFLSGLGKYSEAIECYDRALAINPNDALAWYNKGYTLDEFRKIPSETIECYDRALAIIQTMLRYGITKVMLLIV